MSLLKMAHQAGLDSIEELTRISGMSGETLRNWRKTRPEALKAILKGCKAIKEEQRNDTHTSSEISSR